MNEHREGGHKPVCVTRLPETLALPNLKSTLRTFSVADSPALYLPSSFPVAFRLNTWFWLTYRVLTPGHKSRLDLSFLASLLLLFLGPGFRHLPSGIRPCDQESGKPSLVFFSGPFWGRLTRFTAHILCMCYRRQKGREVIGARDLVQTDDTV